MLNKRQGGFTLVEMMVAMVIGAIIILGAGQLLLTTVTTFQRVEAISREQEALVFAVQSLIRDIRKGEAGQYEINDSLVDATTCALRHNSQPLIEGLYKGSHACDSLSLFEKDADGITGLYRITLQFAGERQAPFVWHVMQRDHVITRVMSLPATEGSP